MDRLLFIDTETTGLFAPYHEIIEICAALVECSTTPSGEFKTEIISIFESKVKPNRVGIVSPEAMKVNRLNLKDLEDATESFIVASDLVEWWQEMCDGIKIVPIGHNYAFDREFLKDFVGRDLYFTMFDYHNEDTYSLAKTLWRQGKLVVNNFSLEALCSALDIPFFSHGAREDVLAEIKLFEKLNKML